LSRTGPQSELALSTQAPVLQRDAENCQKVPKGQAPRVGLEQSADSPRRVQVSETGAAKSAALGDDLPPIDPNLATVTTAWHTLPSDTRTAILAIVGAAQGRKPPDPNHAPVPRSRRDSGYRAFTETLQTAIASAPHKTEALVSAKFNRQRWFLLTLLL